MSVPPQQYPPQQPRRSSKGFQVALIAIVAIVIVVILLLLVFLPTITSHATLKVRVYSTLSLVPINYQLYVDSRLVKEGTIAAGQYVEHTLDLSPGTGCHDYDVFASSTGGTLGPRSASETVHLCNAQTESVNLYV